MTAEPPTSTKSRRSFAAPGQNPFAAILPYKKLCGRPIIAGTLFAEPRNTCGAESRPSFDSSSSAPLLVIER